MKKYIKPTQRVFNVSSCEIIATSVEISTGDNNYDPDKGIDVKEEKGNFFWN